MKRITLKIIAIGAAVAFAEGCSETAPQSKSSDSSAKKLCTLSDPRIDESSGLASSRIAPGVFWTHNDSGDGPRIYAIDKKGRTLATCTLEGARNRDWEDIASFTLDDRPHILLADVGDNSGRRSQCQLYIIPEPKLDREKLSVKPLVTIRFEYEDGPKDCEAVAVDATERKIYLVSKREKSPGVYVLPLDQTQPGELLNAEKIADVNLLFPTAMDISPDGRRAVILTVSHAWEYTRRGAQSWAEAFEQQPRRISMPSLRQGEAICYGPQAKHLYVTSEKRPTPLWEISLQSDEGKSNSYN